MVAAFAAGVMILGCTACGKQGSEGNTETVNVLASDVQTEDVQKEDAETEAAQTKAVTSSKLLRQLTYFAY